MPFTMTGVADRAAAEAAANVTPPGCSVTAAIRPGRKQNEDPSA